MKKQNLMSRKKAIREKCLECSAGNAHDVKECEIVECPLFPFRMAGPRQNPRERQAAIKKMCMWCCNGQPYEIKNCLHEMCAMFPFRGYIAAKKKRKNGLARFD